MSTATSTTAGSAVPGTNVLRVVRNLFARFSGWLAARQRAYDDDGGDLAQLSDRDLHDIGLDRGFVASVARGRWTREGPDV